jgi:hypothetical protein
VLRALCLLKSPFLLRKLMFRAPMATLLGHDVGAALAPRSVAELLGHRGLRMVMRYAHLSRAYLSAEVALLDAPAPSPSTERAKKGNVP